MKIKPIYSAGLLGLLLTASACEKEFLDVNQDPNRPLNSTVQTVLPTALGYTAYTMGNQYQILGGFWAQYWTQGPTANQYNNLDRYVITSDDYNRPWTDLYSGPLRDLQYVYDEGLKLKNNAAGSADKARGGNYAAVARIMQAYVFQTLTDLHGDIPFTQALQGASESGGNITPRYDRQPEVYDGLIRLLDEAATLADPEAAEHPRGDDFVFEGDMAEWLRFANSLKLRVYLRQSEVRPEVARQGVQSLAAAGAEFLSRDAEVRFVDAQFNQNPLYMTFQGLGTTANILASNTALNYLKSTNDPRIGVFFTKAARGPAAGQYNGLDQGQGKAGQFGADMASTHYSKPGPQVAGPESPVILMSAAESDFLQAEAAARGWLPGNAAALYEAGVNASFARWELAEAAPAYLAQPAVAFPAAGSQQEQIEAIITQKWVAMTGTHHVEPWNEWRRTGYPDFLTVSLDTQIGNAFPSRLLYPSSEETRNPNVPAQLTVKDRVWWDVR